MRLLLILLACGALFFGIDRLVHKKGGRSLASKIEIPAPYAFSTPSWDPVPAPLLNQRFFYLKKGCQAYVFVSEDGNYVLKFFKQHLQKPDSFLVYLPFTPQRKHLEAKNRAYEEALKSCALAYRSFRDETALLYIHLCPNHLDTTVELIDRHGRSSHIQLDKTAFVLQKRATLIYPRLSALMRAGDLPKAERTLTSLFDLLQFLGKQGVVDNDPILRKNFGILDERAVQIDIGNLQIDPKRVGTDAYRSDLFNITRNLRSWIEESEPELLGYFDALLAEHHKIQ